MPISPSVLTTIGNKACVSCDETTEGTPCASRSPRTTLASTSDRVRKTVTRSGMTITFSRRDRRPRRVCRSSLLCELRELCVDRRDGGGRQLFDLQQHHRHIIMLRRAVDERGDLAEN